MIKNDDAVLSIRQLCQEIVFKINEMNRNNVYDGSQLSEAAFSFLWQTFKYNSKIRKAYRNFPIPVDEHLSNS